MRGKTSYVLALLTLAGCGKPTVADRIDGLRQSGERFAHEILPAPERHAELNPGQKDNRVHLEDRLLANEHGRAILDAGESAVPELIILLDDEERRTLAAVLLAEIGGERAASALLDRWRSLRGKRVKKHTYLLLKRSPKPQYAAGGYSYEGVDHEFYGEILQGLGFCGRPVSAAVAADTRAAMDESERLHAAGKTLSREEQKEDGKLRWKIGPVETAKEGLCILAMVGAPEAPALFVRALRSPVDSFRWNAVQEAGFIGDGVESVLPALGELLDDPALRKMALREIALILDRTSPPEPLTDEQLEEWVERYKEKLRELGHLPR